MCWYLNLMSMGTLFQSFPLFQLKHVYYNPFPSIKICIIQERKLNDNSKKNRREKYWRERERDRDKILKDIVRRKIFEIKDTNTYIKDVIKFFNS